MARPSIDQWAMYIARAVSTRASCLRRKVGCVLLNNDKRIDGTGYNGAASGLRHCDELKSCPSDFCQTGEGRDDCMAIHAEQNALLQCSDVSEINTCYVTRSPCTVCVKLLLNTGCKRLVYQELSSHDGAAILWLKAGRQWLSLDSAEMQAMEMLRR
jgi:dCMP deaminase